MQGNQEVFCSADGYMALNSSTSAEHRSQIQAHVQRMFADGMFQKRYPPPSYSSPYRVSYGSMNPFPPALPPSSPPVSPSTLSPTLNPDLLVNDRADLSDFLLTSSRLPSDFPLTSF